MLYVWSQSDIINKVLTQVHLFLFILQTHHNEEEWRGKYSPFFMKSTEWGRVESKKTEVGDYWEQFWKLHSFSCCLWRSPQFLLAAVVYALHSLFYSPQLYRAPISISSFFLLFAWSLPKVLISILSVKNQGLFGFVNKNCVLSGKVKMRKHFLRNLLFHRKISRDIFPEKLKQTTFP